MDLSENKDNNSDKKQENNNIINEENNNNEINENEIDDNDNNEINDEYDYEVDNNEVVDNVEKGQEEILENMFINAKNSVNENKIDLYLDIISLDESKEKIWSYKCYQEICLIFLQFEDHLMFPLYYKQLMNAARTFDQKKLRPYIEQTVNVFIDEIKSHFKESIYHWLEDLTIDFNRFQQDKIINMFEANINLKFLLLTKEMNSKKEENEEEEEYDEEKSSKNSIDINIISYLSDKEKLEMLANDYLIKECGCNPEYLDKRGNTFFYFQPEESKRGGEKYNVPVGWTAFGIEVLKRYGDTDWISSDGRTEEWAVAYHGFGVRMDGGQIKNIIKTIIHDNLKPGSGQAFAKSRDCRHPGNLCNIGVYTTPNLDVATQYAGTIPLGGKKYKLIIMSRVNPNYIREPETQKGFWILDGKPNQLRPYRLLIRESNTLVYKRY